MSIQFKKLFKIDKELGESTQPVQQATDGPHKPVYEKKESRIIMRSISKLIESKRKKLLNFFLHSYIYGYILMLFMVAILTLLQVVLIDFNYLELNNLKQRTKQSSLIIRHLCHHLEKNHHTEEFIYLVFATLFFLLLIVKQKKKRFTNYIMNKFRKHADLLDTSQTCGRFRQFSFTPLFTFSTSNRSQSAAVYIIYTYDVLNIFMFIYVSDLSASLIPLFNSSLSGVLFDFLKQILQVLLIGVKFYPILIVADLDPSIVLYLATTLYISLIWLIRFVNKAFCSHRKAVVEFALNQLIGDLNQRINLNLLTHQAANKTASLAPNDRYRNIINNVFPKVFRNAFDETKTVLMTPSSIELVKNVYDPNEVNKWIGFVQHLPIYVTISYLLTRYVLLLTASLVDRVKENMLKQKNRYQLNELAAECTESKKNLDFIINTNPDDLVIFNPIMKPDEPDVNEKNIIADALCKIQNNNYKYIFALLTKRQIRHVGGGGAGKYLNGRRLIDKSFLYHFFESILSRVYRSVPHMKFSKQFVNTYTVAFMIVYSFSLLGMRLANMFNELLVKCTELAWSCGSPVASRRW